MTTEIRNFAGDRAVRIYPIRHRGQSGVGVMIRQNGEYVLDAHLPRADFLAAVDSELDVIVIPRADLPEVKEIDQGYPIAIVPGWAPIAPINNSAEEVRTRALACLALAEYMDREPPVDEAEVEALVTDFGAVPLLPEETEALARRLVAAGWKR